MIRRHGITGFSERGTVFSPRDPAAVAAIPARVADRLKLALQRAEAARVAMTKLERLPL